MFPKESCYNSDETEKILFHPMDCFGCNWYCIYKEPYCLTKIDATAVFSSIEKILSE